MIFRHPITGVFRDTRQHQSALAGLLLAALLILAHPAWSTDQAGIAELQALRDSDPAALLERIAREQTSSQASFDPHYLAHQYRLRAEVLRNRGDYELARQDAIEFQRRGEILDDPLLLSRAFMLHGTLDAEQSNIASALDRSTSANASSRC